MVRFTFVIIKIGIQIIGEKEGFQNGKHDKKFNQCYNPKGFAYGHVCKSITVENV